MSETQQLIEQVRAKMDGATDYKVAQVLDIPRHILHYYVSGERSADSYACARIAEILDRDPLHVIAQVEAESARSEKKREYWRSLFSGLRRRAHVALLSVIAGFSAPALTVGETHAQMKSTHNGRLRQRIGDRRRTPERRKAA